MVTDPATMRHPLREDPGGPGAVEDGRAGQQGAVEPRKPDGLAVTVKWLIVDLVACVVFVYGLVLMNGSTTITLSVLGVLVVSMAAWRLRRLRVHRRVEAGVIPYTCGVVRIDGVELYLVASVHISPRAPQDVQAVIGNVNPDLVMIELDDERLNSMRAAPTVLPRQVDLQPIDIEIPSQGETRRFFAQRAYWNAEFAGTRVDGPTNYDQFDEFGLAERVMPGGSVAVVKRGGPEGSLATFSMKSHVAARCGADAVLVINHVDNFPRAARIGAGSLKAELRVAFRARSCGFPPVPLLLLPKDAGELLMRCNQEHTEARVKFEVADDNFPRRSLRRRVCQDVAFALSGFWLLYGIIECFSVDAGDEFLVAESTARARGVPCACIDVDMNRLCSRVAWAMVPSPCNILRALWAWLSFPRLLFSALFPGQNGVDVIGATVLHARSFRCRTWVALLSAALCAGAFVAVILTLLSSEAAGAAAGSGVVPSGTDTTLIQSFIMLAVEMYAFPRLYEAVAASRDEAMYQGIVAKTAEHNARRLVVVVGAAHANGILERARRHGLRRE